jgi:RNA polymerase sigma-70 factor, ECF subfamily
VFDYDYPSIAHVLERSEASSRQLVTRARKHLDARTPRFEPDRELRDRMLELFLAAAEDGDVQALERLLADDAVLYSDGGGKAVASRHPIHSAQRIARAMVAVVRKQRRRGPFEMELVRVNGQPGRVLRTADGGVWDVLSIDVANGRIQAVRIVRNPDKLAHV